MKVSGRHIPAETTAGAKEQLAEAGTRNLGDQGEDLRFYSK